ncbi:MAG: hypothetical protein AB8C84_07995 [Oligoflexales bacterium]
MANQKQRLVFVFGTCCLLLLAFLKVHISVQTTLVGYKIGRLKSDESQLLELRSSLTAKLAQITSRTSLTKLAQTNNEVKAL